MQQELHEGGTKSTIRRGTGGHERHYQPTSHTRKGEPLKAAKIPPGASQGDPDSSPGVVR